MRTWAFSYSPILSFSPPTRTFLWSPFLPLLSWRFGAGRAPVLLKSQAWPSETVQVTLAQSRTRKEREKMCLYVGLCVKVVWILGASSPRCSVSGAKFSSWVFFFFSAAGTKGERKRVQMKGEEEEEMNGSTAKVATLRKVQIQWFPIRPYASGIRPLLPPLFLQCVSPVIS